MKYGFANFWKEGMSALGHKRTLKRLQPMSALPPKADITSAVRRNTSLFDHLVRSGEQAWRHNKVELLRNLEIDSQHELIRGLNR